MNEYQQFVVVVEACESSKSDWNYFRKFIECALFLPQNGRLLLKPVFLDGKPNYRKDKKQQEILTFIKKYPGQTTVLYCFDTDRGGHTEKRLNLQIQTYCHSLSYSNKTIWFCKDIENVFLGHGVPDGRKRQTALSFHDSGKVNLEEQDLYALTRKNPQHNSESNILCALSSLLPLKESYSKLVHRFLKK